MEERETVALIGSDKVAGTTVYGADGERVGSIERVMIEKTSGQVSYAVLSFGGILGIGSDRYPLPWKSLVYDERLGGYVSSVTKDQLDAAPRYSNEADWSWEDTGRTSALNDYYKNLT